MIGNIEEQSRPSLAWRWANWFEIERSVFSVYLFFVLDSDFLLERLGVHP
ncbi:MAG: hypothetical protein BMS9Abin05_1297 [Rhodothermia bacterium]|nr:MAG: hypothetical protein BMS9Abin05_1297 [Rhodothermia bacterium]